MPTFRINLGVYLRSLCSNRSALFFFLNWQGQTCSAFCFLFVFFLIYSCQVCLILSYSIRCETIPFPFPVLYSCLLMLIRIIVWNTSVRSENYIWLACVILWKEIAQGNTLLSVQYFSANTCWQKNYLKKNCGQKLLDFSWFYEENSITNIANFSCIKVSAWYLCLLCRKCY